MFLLNEHDMSVVTGSDSSVVVDDRPDVGTKLSFTEMRSGHL